MNFRKEGSILTDDYETLEYYGIVNGASIRVVDLLNFTIQIDSLDGRLISLEVRKTDTIFDVAKKLKDKIPFHKSEHGLLFRGSILKFNNDKIVDYGVKNGSNLKVINKVDVRVAKPNSTFMIDRCGANANADIGNYTWNGLHHTGGRIMAQSGRAPAVCAIFSEDELRDNTSETHQTSHAICIFVKKENGQIIQFKMKEFFKIIELKEQIKVKENISVSDQQLYYHGNRLENEDTLHNIVQNSVLDLIVLRDIQIWVNYDSTTLIFHKDKFKATLRDLKKDIAHKMNIPFKCIVLKLNRQILHDMHATLHSCGITNGSTIEVFRASLITIWIFPHDMEAFPLEVYTTDRVIDVKKKIYAKILLPVKDQQLQFMATTLDNHRHISQAGINDKGEVILRRTRGICLIISNETFVDDILLPKRIGTKHDEDAIQKTFEDMGYETKIHQDVSSNRIEDIIKDTKELADSAHNMLIVFIMSHGTKKAFYTSDDVLFKFKNVWTPFSNINFQTLAGKHKIFFFVCCRGTDLNKCINVNQDSSDAVNGNGNSVAFDAPGVGDVGTGVDPCPSRGNMFFGFATCEDYMSCRQPKKGTFYVQCLCEVIQKYPQWSVSDIHQEVQRILSRKYEKDPHKELYVQLPTCTNELTEHAYF